MPYGITQLIPESLSSVTATNSVALGTVYQSGFNEYTYVHNGSTSTASVGYGVVRTNYSAGTCTVSATTGQRIVGVVQNADIPALNYGWVVSKGPVAIMAKSAIAVGTPIMVETDGAFLTVLSAIAGVPDPIIVGSTLSACVAGAITAKAWIQ